jgi:acyl carrier protein
MDNALSSFLVGIRQSSPFLNLMRRILTHICVKDIKKMLEDILPLVDFDSDFLFAELDSLGITAILMTLSNAYGIDLESKDVTPKNFKNIDSLTALVEKKLSEKDGH